MVTIKQMDKVYKQTEMAKQLFKERKQWQDKVKKIKAETLAEIKAWTQKDIEDIQSVARLEEQKENQKKVEELLKRKFITNQGSKVVAVYSVNEIFNPKREDKQ